MAASVAGEERNVLAFQPSQHVSVRRCAKRGFQHHFVDIGQPWHGIKPAASDDSDFGLRQCFLAFDEIKANRDYTKEIQKPLWNNFLGVLGCDPFTWRRS